MGGDASRHNGPPYVEGGSLRPCPLQGHWCQPRSVRGRSAAGQHCGWDAVRPRTRDVELDLVAAFVPNVDGKSEPKGTEGRLAMSVKTEIEQHPLLLNLARNLNYRQPGATLLDLRQELER